MTSYLWDGFSSSHLGGGCYSAQRSNLFESHWSNQWLTTGTVTYKVGFYGEVGGYQRHEEETNAEAGGSDQDSATIRGSCFRLPQGETRPEAEQEENRETVSGT